MLFQGVMKFCLDQNLVYYANGQLAKQFFPPIVYTIIYNYESINRSFGYRQSLRARQRERLPMAFEKIPNKIDPKRAKR
jgi:hypothetical protein